MKTWPSIVVTALCLIGIAPAFAGETLRVVEHAANEITTDIGSKGDSAGDLASFVNPVFDANNAKQIGTDHGFCIRVVAGKSWECFWTLILPEGQISIEGPFMDSGDSLMTVTGGAGKYTGARGQLKIHPRDPKTSAYDFTYELL